MALVFRIKCAGCGKTIKAGDDWAGKRGKCPNCGTDFVVPHHTTVVEPKQLPGSGPAPHQSVSPAPPPALTPFTFDSPAPPPAVPQVTIEHRHKATGGAFRSGFGIALGCLTAGAVFIIGGCLVIGMIAKTAVDSSKLPATSHRSAGAGKPLDKLEILNASLTRSGQFDITPTITITARNNTGKPIKTVHFHGIYKTAGRSLPWAEDDINYSPEGGLEVGEKQTWNLSPGFLSKFRDVDVHSGATLNLSVVDIDFVD